MKKSLENLLAQQGIALLNTLSKEERRARTETIKARYREAGYDDLPHELVTFLTIFDDKDIKRRDGYMVFYIFAKSPHSPRDAILRIRCRYYRAYSLWRCQCR